MAAAVMAGLEAEPREKLAIRTVGELLRQATAAGLRRPTSEPLNFAL